MSLPSAPDSMRAPAASHQTCYHPHNSFNQGLPPDVGGNSGHYTSHHYPGALPHPPTTTRPSLPVSRQCAHNPHGNQMFQCPPPPPFTSVPPPPRHCLNCPPPTWGFNNFQTETGPECRNCNNVPLLKSTNGLEPISNGTVTQPSVPLTNPERMVQSYTVQVSSFF